MPQDNNGPIFNTRHPFAILSGFLVLPAISAFFTFLMSVYIVIYSNPAQLDSMRLIAYISHVIFIPYLFVSFYYWYRRKKFLPILMAIFFAIQALINIGFTIYGIENEFMNVAINTIWTIYFLVSRRVKETFTY